MAAKFIFDEGGTYLHRLNTGEVYFCDRLPDFISDNSYLDLFAFEKHMRNWLLAVNGVVTVFFMAFFAYTFFGRGHIDRLARDFVTSKTQKYADSVADIAKELLKAQFIRDFFTDEEITAFEREIAAYHKNPKNYIAELTGKRGPAAVKRHNNPFVAKITQWKQKVRAYYDKVLGRLIVDLRIFTGSNCCAAAFGAWLASRERTRRTQKITSASLLPLLAVFYGVYMYVDGFSFFKIMFNLYVGWWYPVILVAIYGDLYRDARRHRKSLASR